jgi:hypothetical protein
LLAAERCADIHGFVTWQRDYRGCLYDESGSFADEWSSLLIANRMRSIATTGTADKKATNVRGNEM